MTVALSIVCPSSGRETLEQTLESCRRGMKPGDELLVAVTDDCPGGNPIRDELMRQVPLRDRTRSRRRMHRAILFIDDDDLYLKGGLDVIRAGFAEDPQRMHIFRMQYATVENGKARLGQVFWQEPELYEGNVGTPMIVVPAHGPLGSWSNRYQADFDFALSTAERLGEPVWHEEIVALVTPPRPDDPRHT